MDDGKLSRSDSAITGSSIAQVYRVNDGSNGRHDKSAKATILDDTSYRARRILYSILVSLFVVLLWVQCNCINENVVG